MMGELCIGYSVTFWGAKPHMGQGGLSYPLPNPGYSDGVLSFEFFRIWKMEEFQTDLMTLSMSSIHILE